MKNSTVVSNQVSTIKVELLVKKDTSINLTNEEIIKDRVLFIKGLELTNFVQGTEGRTMSLKKAYNIIMGINLNIDAKNKGLKNSPLKYPKIKQFEVLEKVMKDDGTFILVPYKLALNSKNLLLINGCELISSESTLSNL